MGYTRAYSRVQLVFHAMDSQLKVDLTPQVELAKPKVEPADEQRSH
jgi:hypothetical protein